MGNDASLVNAIKDLTKEIKRQSTLLKDIKEELSRRGTYYTPYTPQVYPFDPIITTTTNGTGGDE